MESLIKQEHEFYEVLNAFPNLRERLEDLKFCIKDLDEHKTIKDYLLEKSYSEDEIDIFVKKLNSDVNYFLKTGNFPKFSLKKEFEILDSN